MSILLARHAQSPENLYGKGALGTLPQIEIPLSEDGIRQASILGGKLVGWCRSKDKAALKIYASPYRRVQETAGLIEKPLTKAGIGFSQISDPQLSEVDFLPRGAALMPGRILFGTRALAHESVMEIERRLHSMIEKIRTDEKSGQSVLVLTHSTVMRGLAALLCGRALTELGDLPRPDNCTLWQIDETAAPVCIFAGFAPPARIAAPEDKSGTRTLDVRRKETDA